MDHRATGAATWEKAPFAFVRTREPNLPTDPEANRERFATSRRQPHGNREGPIYSFCKYRKKRKPPIILAWLGCFFAHLSYSPRTACLASSFFMLAMPTETLTVPLTVTEPKSVGI